MSIKDIIDAVIKAEGGSKSTDDPHDAGGRTQYGIAERSNPEAWLDNHVSEEEARAIYTNKYVIGPGFDKINDPHLKHLLVDWGVLSGPGIAIKCLQQSLNLKDDGILGAITLAAANNADSRRLTNQLVVARAKMVGRIVQKNPSQARFISGWLNRIFEFFRL